jgi:hypothetical protein
MRILLDEEESWSLMSLIVAQVIDQVEIEETTVETLREWRHQRPEGSEGMLQLSYGMNEALGNKIDEETTRVIRRKDYFRKA